MTDTGSTDLGQCERVTDGQWARCPEPATREVDGDYFCGEHADEEEAEA